MYTLFPRRKIPTSPPTFNILLRIIKIVYYLALGVSEWCGTFIILGYGDSDPLCRAQGYVEKAERYGGEPSNNLDLVLSSVREVAESTV